MDTSQKAHLADALTELANLLEKMLLQYDNYPVEHFSPAITSLRLAAERIDDEQI